MTLIYRERATEKEVEVKKVINSNYIVIHDGFRVPINRYSLNKFYTFERKEINKEYDYAVGSSKPRARRRA